jgi:hypothetical protein
MSIESFFSDAGAGILGGAVLTAILFTLREHVYPLPNINGRWFVQTLTKSSVYKPYKDMLLKHEVIIWQEGACIRGSSEKIFENSVNGPRQFEGKNRSQGQVDGFVTQFYVPRKNRIRLHVKEVGVERASTIFFDLVYKKDVDRMTGIFEGTAGSVSGDSEWSRNRYDSIFEPSVQKESSAVEGDITFLTAEAEHLEAD